MKECNVEELKEVYSKKQQHKDILQNTWHKLYMLQNYNITMDMFKGTNLRWSSIITYLSKIRAIYKGYSKNTTDKSLISYIQNLMDSGTEPYAKVDKRIVTVQQLLDNNLLTPYEVDYIFSGVGVTEEPPDVSQAWTKCSSDRQIDEIHRDSYTTIVEQLPDPVIHPSKKQDVFKPLEIEINSTTNPIVKNKDIKDIYKKAFKLV